jgi:hypothetical protein
MTSTDATSSGSMSSGMTDSTSTTSAK